MEQTIDQVIETMQDDSIALHIMAIRCEHCGNLYIRINGIGYCTHCGGDTGDIEVQEIRCHSIDYLIRKGKENGL